MLSRTLEHQTHVCHQALLLEYVVVPRKYMFVKLDTPLGIIHSSYCNKLNSYLCFYVLKSVVLYSFFLQRPSYAFGEPMSTTTLFFLPNIKPHFDIV